MTVLFCREMKEQLAMADKVQVMGLWYYPLKVSQMTLLEPV